MGEKETTLVECLSSYPNLSLHFPRENKWWLIAAKSTLRDRDKANAPETSPPEGKEGNGRCAYIERIPGISSWADW